MLRIRFAKSLSKGKVAVGDYEKYKEDVEIFHCQNEGITLEEKLVQSPQTGLTIVKNGKASE